MGATEKREASYMPHVRSIRTGSRVIPGSRGRLTEWFASALVTGLSSLAANTFVLDQSLTAAELAKRPFTITRTIGSIYMGSDQVAATENPFGALGLMVVSAKAVATGATAVPDPISEQASDSWFVYRSFLQTGSAVLSRPLKEFMFDSRAQRKVEDGDDIAVVVANGSSGFGLQYLINFRMLVKLS